MTTDEKFDLILSKLDTMDKRLDTIENRLDKLEQNQLETQMTLENTINKCIDALGEGFALNAERLDRFNVETIKHKPSWHSHLQKLQMIRLSIYLKS